MQDNQLSLNYEPISTTANREYLRANFTRANEEVYFIPLSTIEERSGFNDRTEYDEIDELADSIMANGLEVPLTVDVLPDGKVYVEKGHRRLRAIKLINERNGELTFDLVKCFVNKASRTELQRTVSVYTSNMNVSKLKPLEQASNAWKVKHCFGPVKSNDEVARLLGISRQKVDYLLLLHEQPAEIKEEIKKGKLSATEAVNLVRANKKAKKQAEEKEDEMNTTSAKVNTTQKDSLAGDMAELKALEEMPIPQESKEHGEVAVTPEDEEIKEDDDFEEDENTGTTATPQVKSESQPPASKKDDDDGAPKYDESRPEIADIQNVIKNLDKIESIVSKINVPDGTKKDIADLVEWSQRSAQSAREWIHKNKKQNKIR